MSRALVLCIIWLAALAALAHADSFTATGDYFDDEDEPREKSYAPPIEEAYLGYFELTPEYTVTFSGFGLSPPSYTYWEIEINDNDGWYDPADVFPAYTGIETPNLMHTFTSPGNYLVKLTYYGEEDEPLAVYRARYHIARESELFNWDEDRWNDDYLDPDWPYLTLQDDWGGAPAGFVAFTQGDTGKKSQTASGGLEARLAIKILEGPPWKVVCSAGGSAPAGEIVKYEWDLDYDGDFNLDTGRNPVLEKTLKLPGRYIFTLRVTDWRGQTATTEIEFNVP